MESIWNFSIWSIIILSTILAFLIGSRRKKYSVRRLPPGPKGWPIIGNIFDIGTLPHRSLFALKQKYGPVVWLNICSRKTMALLTADVVAEYLKIHDVSVDRITIDALRSHDFHKTPIFLAPEGGYWRAMKRVCTVELFSNKRINETREIRQKCVKDMLLWIEREMEQNGGGEVEVANFVFPALFNVLGNSLLSRDLVDAHSALASEFCTALTEFIECLATPNVSDLFPWLSWLDLQGVRRKTDVHLGKLLDIASGFVKERIKERKEGTEMRRNTDYLDVLLDFRGSKHDEPATLSEQEIAGLILELFMAGTDTSKSTIEWAMSEVVGNPQVMMKIKAELHQVVGPNKRFEEADIPNMPYLKAVIKETLRLHSTVPLLLPKKLCKDMDFMGYTIPKGTHVLVNLWAVGRDPKYWEDPSSFKPERFLGSDIDYKGKHFELIPFSSGKRICAGLPLADRVIHLIFGSLIHEFEWEVDHNVIAQTTEMKERNGITAQRFEPFKAIPKRKIGVL